jgi:hypothetical protein
MIPGMMSLGGKTQELTPVDLTYINRYTSELNATSHTYSISTGTPSEDRFIVIGAATTITSGLLICSIDTLGTTTLGSKTTFINNGVGTRWFGRYMPTGTTASVRITYSATVARGAIAVWSLKNLLHSGVTTDFLEESNTGTIDVYSGGVILAMYGVNSSNGDTNVGRTWSGVNERFDLELENSLRWSGGDHLSTFGEIDKAISVTPANPGNLTAISFR